jgi:hypothetical protein
MSGNAQRRSCDLGRGRSRGRSGDLNVALAGGTLDLLSTHARIALDVLIAEGARKFEIAHKRDAVRGRLGLGWACGFGVHGVEFA